MEKDDCALTKDNQLQKPAKTVSQLLSTVDNAILHTLRTSIYPGASDESIAMVVAYCNAKQYDPLAKAVHIVPMMVKTGKKTKGNAGYDYDEKAMRDVIMPGISSYRIDASRTGCYAGISEPEFGPMVTEKLGDEEFTFPEWCKVTAKKIVCGQIVEFTAIEYWLENYATTSSKTSAPNAMWKKRKRGQLAKCAEAQALRKAFPDAVGNQPTFEEMEGKTLDLETFIQSEAKMLRKGLSQAKEILGITHQEKSSEVIDTETGEIKSQQFSKDDISAMIQKATSLDDLEVTADLARELSEDDKKIIRPLHYEKKKELIAKQ